MPARTSSLWICATRWTSKRTRKRFPVPFAWTRRISRKNRTGFLPAAKSFSTVLDPTRPPAPVWRCYCEGKACKASRSPAPSLADHPLTPSRVRAKPHLEPRQHDPALRLILPFLVLVAHFAVFVREKENYLAKPFVCVDFRRQRRGVADLQRHEPFPLRLERRDVHDDAAPRVRGLAHANREYIARNPEIFHRTRQREGVRRNNAHLPFIVHQRARIEMFGIHDRRIHVGEDAKFVRDPDVVPVGRDPVADNPVPHLPVRERLDHFVFERHAPNPAVWLHGHPFPPVHCEKSFVVKRHTV